MSVQEDEAEDAHRYILKISMSIDGSESGLIGIPLGWGLYGPEPECAVDGSRACFQCDSEPASEQASSLSLSPAGRLVCQ